MIIIIENFISNWLKDILIVFIVISFLEIILPKGKMKKFVNFIIGLLIIFVIIGPFTDLVGVQLDFDMRSDDFINRDDTQEIIREQESKITEVFTNSLNEEIKGLVESNSNYKVVDVNTNTKEDQDTVLIQEVSLTISNNKENNRGDINIEQIQIGDSNQTINDNGNNHDDIENLITDYLGIDGNIVYISEID